MNLVNNNPYRILGLLVGATAREKEKQSRRLLQYIHADQEPPIDFHFPQFGPLIRTTENVNAAVSQLNLDIDKMGAALFWFFNGNAITDEPVFDAIKDGDLDQALTIWTKLTTNGEVIQRNASAYSNLGTLFLSGILEGTNSNEALLEKGISLKLKFLESDFIKEFKTLVADETFKTTKAQLQLLFLNQIQVEIEKSGEVSSNKFLDIITKQEFSAKEDFLKGFIRKPIEEIEKQIEETKTKRSANNANAINAGNALYNQCVENLNQLKTILGTSDLKFASISDKVSDEILQCGIDYFSHFKDSSTDPGSASMDLFRKAKTLAVGSIAKQRCNESNENLQEWIDEKPERDKRAKIKEELDFIASKLQAFQELQDTVSNARNLVDSCKPKIFKIKSILGSSDEFYLGLSSAIVNNAQNMLVQAVNIMVNQHNNNPLAQFRLSNADLEHVITRALDTTFKLSTFDIHPTLKPKQKENLDGIKSLARQLDISTLTPKERLQNELQKAEGNLKNIKNYIYLDSEIDNARNEMSKIKEWQFLRSQSEKDRQISEQQKKIDLLLKQSAEEKSRQVLRQQSVINDLKNKIQKAEY